MKLLFLLINYVFFYLKLISFFFPTGGENKKIRFNDLYRSVNQMLSWSVQEQLGFIFYLFDYNEDGFICIQDLFHLLRELNDQDHVLREDVNKLIQILKEKGKRLRKTKQISPAELLEVVIKRIEYFNPKIERRKKTGSK